MSKPEIFMHDFKSKETICKEFGIDADTLDGCHVYLAYYHIGNYGCDSSAFVLFEKDGKLFEVHGSHCSCYDLSEPSWHEDCVSQWQPEEVCVGALEHRLEHGSLGSVGGYDDEGYEKESRQVVEYLKQNLHCSD